MKIIVSVLADLNEMDGTSVRANRIYKILKNKFEVSLIHRGKLDSPGIISIIPEKTKFWNFKLIPIILKNQIDLVYCCTDYFGFLTYFLLSKFYKYEIIFEAHGIKSKEYFEGSDPENNLIERIKFKFYQILENFVIKNSNYVIALSNDIYNYYKHLNNEMSIIPVFVDEEKFISNSIKLENSNYKTLGLIGPFTKGNINNEFLKFLIDNFGKFNENIKFKVIGECDNKIENDKILYTGYLSNSEYVQSINSLNALLVPSKYPSYGALNKVLEAMSCSIPVFATSKATIGIDNLKNFQNILVFREDELIDNINNLLFDDNLMKGIGFNSRITIEKYYSKKVIEQQLINIIKERSGSYKTH